MNELKIWLSSPHMSGGEQVYVNEAFNSNWIAPLGPNVNRFEEDISKFLSPSDLIHTSVLNSGTAEVLISVKSSFNPICLKYINYHIKNIFTINFNIWLYSDNSCKQ